MGDGRCGWCGAPLPESAGPGRGYCHQAHRQAAWRARRRRQASPAGVAGGAAAETDLLAQVEADERARRGAESCHVAAVAEVPWLAGHLVRCAVSADRRAGASWAQIGARLGIGAEAARSRFGRLEGSLARVAGEVRV